MEFGDNWNDFRGAGEYGLLGEPPEGVDGAVWAEKRSNHMVWLGMRRSHGACVQMSRTGLDVSLAAAECMYR